MSREAVDSNAAGKMSWFPLVLIPSFLGCFFLSGGFLSAQQTSPQSLDEDGMSVQAISFNIRLSYGRDGENRWENRKEIVRDLIRREASDFVGIQEAILDESPEWNQVSYLREQLPEYGVFVRSRLEDPEMGESAPILYRKDRWRIDEKESGTFWLSDTPERPASTSWGNEIPRIVTWGLFHEKGSDRAVYFYNTHWDHRSEPSRRRSARLLAERIAQREREEIPVIVTGDFNCGESSEGIRYLLGTFEDQPPSGGKLVDPYRVVHPEATEVGTFTGFGAKPGREKIDFVLVGPNWEILSARILRDRPGGRWPSDHLPVSATLRWGE